MSKKYYILFAQLFRYLLGDTALCETTLKVVVNNIIDLFANDNPRFDKDRFLNAIYKE